MSFKSKRNGSVLGPDRATGYMFPSQISGLICAISANQSVPLNTDGSVLPSTINDISGSGNSGTRFGSPLFRTNRTPSGQPAFQSQSGGYIMLGDIWNGFSAGHAFAYVKTEQSSGNDYGPWQLGGAFYPHYPWTDNQIYEGGFTNAISSAVAPSKTVRNVWRIYELASDGDWFVKLDGDLQMWKAAAFVPPTSTNRLLATTWGSGTTMFIAEFLAFNRKLTNEEAASIRDYLVGINGATG